MEYMFYGWHDAFRVIAMDSPANGMYVNTSHYFESQLHLH